MLVLTRKINQEIIIDGGIKIQVLKINGNTTRIGIEAPDHLVIRRGELITDGKPAARMPRLEDLKIE